MTKGMIIRGFLGKRLVFVSQVELSLDDLENMERFIAALAESHAEETNAGRVDMIELEFPDDPPEERFFRMGVNPDGMWIPLKVVR